MNEKIQNKYYRFIFDNSLDAMMLTSPDGRIYRVNAAACEMFGRTEEEICALGRAGLIDANDPRLAPALAERIEKGHVHVELSFFRKDGSVFPGDCTSSVFNDDDGKTWTVTIIRDVTAFRAAEAALQKAQDEMTHLATHDYLTGLLNRRAFVDSLQREMIRAIRQKHSMSVLLLDIDLFKQVNDLYGHEGGDVVLKQFANGLAGNLRPYDIVGRYGGDEFIVCLPDTDYNAAIEVASRLSFYVEQMEIYYKDTIIKITMSVGVAVYQPENEENMDAFIARVDKSLYQVKNERKI